MLHSRSFTFFILSILYYGNCLIVQGKEGPHHLQKKTGNQKMQRQRQRRSQEMIMEDFYGKDLRSLQKDEVCTLF